jgi:SWI/SNF-related matrix-associated actin-dependent regulator of chromatin subfamily A member 5
LLTQPDIFEYLRKLNNDELEEPEEKNKTDQDISMELDQETKTNKRHARDGKEDKNSESKEGYDNENIIEKIEVQPENITFGKMRGYQLDALNWLNSLHEAKLNGILADEMGLGKTIESISIIALIEGRKTEEQRLKRKKFHIIIVPKVTLNKWKKELNNWYPTLRVFKFYGNQEEKEIMKANELKERNFD